MGWVWLMEATWMASRLCDVWIPHCFVECPLIALRLQLDLEAWGVEDVWTSTFFYFCRKAKGNNIRHQVVWIIFHVFVLQAWKVFCVLDRLRYCDQNQRKSSRVFLFLFSLMCTHTNERTSQWCFGLKQTLWSLIVIPRPRAVHHLSAWQPEALRGLLLAGSFIWTSQ